MGFGGLADSDELRPDLKKITCPVLALYAEKDFAVPRKLNVPAMRALLAGNQAGEVEELPDLNLSFKLRTWAWGEKRIGPKRPCHRQC